MKTATLFHRRSPVVRADAPGKGGRPVLCGPQAAAGSLSFVTARVAGGHSTCRTSFQLARSKVAKSRARSNALACAASASGDKPWRENDARLVLENGQVFPGVAFGHTEDGIYVAEVVFNTLLTGYQEILTDPSYHGQMVSVVVAPDEPPRPPLSPPRAFMPGLPPKVP